MTAPLPPLPPAARENLPHNEIIGLQYPNADGEVPGQGGVASGYGTHVTFLAQDTAVDASGKVFRAGALVPSGVPGRLSVDATGAGSLDLQDDDDSTALGPTVAFGGTGLTLGDPSPVSRVGVRKLKVVGTGLVRNVALFFAPGAGALPCNSTLSAAPPRLLGDDWCAFATKAEIQAALGTWGGATSPLYYGIIEDASMFSGSGSFPWTLDLAHPYNGGHRAITTVVPASGSAEVATPSIEAGYTTGGPSTVTAKLRFQLNAGYTHTGADDILTLLRLTTQAGLSVAVVEVWRAGQTTVLFDAGPLQLYFYGGLNPAASYQPLGDPASVFASGDEMVLTVTAADGGAGFADVTLDLSVIGGGSLASYATTVPLSDGAEVFAFGDLYAQGYYGDAHSGERVVSFLEWEFA